MKLPKELIEKFKEPFISELENYINSEVELIVKVKSKRLLENKNGQKYLLITFEDKTGILRAIDWFNAEKNDSKIDVGNVVRANGKVVLYDGRLQLNILQDSDIIVLNNNEYSYERFVAESKIPIDVIMKDLNNMIKSIKNYHLKKLLEEIFNDKELSEKFKEAPAGLKIHHNYRGGLAEHSITVAKMCDNLSKVYPWINRDLLITGALLHDIGKIYDYVINPKGIEITKSGELIGHIVKGYEIVEKKIESIGLNEELKTELLHMIISHHGELEWGSPIVPKTPEAFILHMIENLDSKLNRIQNIKEKELETNPDKEWSDFDPNLGRRFLLKHIERG
ncbi:phosphohydrolase [Thermosipho melanesiensis]|uniref:Metal dependent phosphohydrolase n=2 Tax=Thermosipho melanesiensis TaxID=46541 RepID=A6LLT5_THEM4|nr:HD domain-containing protein [Thermosipho melanesiensis]ABR30886.1 metal dependent phosphohydrolase [Thermosipho melanesiensis BI429]APT74005.1 phosphohydrolase [Thermosipho melanesiensis]OOC35934.1 phosphohydrolase [Thermosipho melanesiensis]OOC38436.1 phosphohydrolase [Thermosipho melanesiensis]OOC38897.1 phosphohydrolase [Thermosipho melanesiensis]